jgi:hypothetical protein
MASLGLLCVLAAQGAHAQTFTAMNRQVEGFLTGLWVKTAAPADRPPNEAEVTAGLTHCDESMLDPRNEDKSARVLFPSENSSRGDVSMFRVDDAFVLVERMQKPDGIKYPFPRKVTVGAVQQQNRIIVRFVSRAQWMDGAWKDQPSGTPALWGDAMLGDLEIGGNTEHVLVLGKDNTQTTYVKCGS